MTLNRTNIMRTSDLNSYLTLQSVDFAIDQDIGVGPTTDFRGKTLSLSSGEKSEIGRTSDSFHEVFVKKREDSRADIRESETRVHTWKPLPQSEKGKILFTAATRSLTWIQAGSRRTAAIVGSGAVRASEALKKAGVVGSFVAFGTFSIVALGNFTEAIQILREGGPGKISNAAKKVAMGLGASAAAIGNLATGLASISKIVIIPAGTLVGSIATSVCFGIGPFISAALDLVQLRGLRAKAAIIQQELSELKNQQDKPAVGDELSSLTETIRKKEMELDDNHRQQRVTGLKIAGAAFYGAMQVALAFGTAGMSVGVMLAISVGTLALTSLVEYAAHRRAEARRNLAQAAA